MEQEYGGIWSFKSGSKESDWKDVITLTNDKLSENVSFKEHDGDIEISTNVKRKMLNPWKPARGIDACKYKFSREITIKDGVKLENGICVGVENKKPVLYDFFSRSDLGNAPIMNKLDSKMEKHNSFVKTVNFMVAGMIGFPQELDGINYKNKTNYKELLGLN